MELEEAEKEKQDVSQITDYSQVSEARKGLAGRIVKRNEVTASAIQSNSSMMMMNDQARDDKSQNTVPISNRMLEPKDF